MPYFGTLGLGATPASLGRLWRMVAHHHGQYLNASECGRSLGETPRLCMLLPGPEAHLTTASEDDRRA